LGLDLRTWIIVVAVILLIAGTNLATFFVISPSLQSSDTINRVKAVRFYGQAEVVANASWNVIEFLWKPKDPSNNAILDAVTYFQINSTVFFFLSIDGIKFIQDRFAETKIYLQYQWSDVYVRTAGINATISTPNLEHHIIQFGFLSPVSPHSPVYVKDLNIILEVVDGLPPS
jgi:hypothetical protein